MKRAGIAIATASGALAALVIVAVILLIPRSPDPGATALAYLRAVEAGDAAAAAALLDASPTEGAPEALAGAASRIAQPQLDGDASVSEASATVPVLFTLDGQTQRVTLSLVSTASGWRVTESGLGDLTVTTSRGGVTVGGTRVPADASLRLFPAVYVVAPSPGDLLTGSTSAAVTLTSAGPEPVSLDPAVSPAATTTAQTELDRYLSGCVKPAATVPPHCGISIPWAADLATLDTIRYRIDTAPQLRLTADGSDFVADGGVLVATATGTDPDGNPGTFTYRTDRWSVRGTVSFTPEAMELVVW